MNFQSVDYIIAVAEEMSISRAAKRLHITQQTLSAHLAALETELGCRLFVRHVPLEITYAGEEFLKYARTIREQLIKMRHTFEAISKEEKGILKIGITSNRGRTVLFPVLLAFRKAHPGIELKIVEDTNETLIQKLEKGEIDIGISDFSGEHPGIRVEYFYREHVIFVVRRDLFNGIYGENTQDVIRRIREQGEGRLLQDCPILLGHEQDVAGRLARRLIGTFDTPPLVAAEAQSMSLLLEMCAAGLGGCFCPDVIAEGLLPEEKRRELLFINLGQKAEYDIGLGWKTEWHLIDAFVQAAKAEAGFLQKDIG